MRNISKVFSGILLCAASVGYACSASAQSPEWCYRHPAAQVAACREFRPQEGVSADWCYRHPAAQVAACGEFRPQKGVSADWCYRHPYAQVAACSRYR
jgi:hypothetical protein